MTKGKKMNSEDIKILEENDWIVECESPFEIRHKDGGSFASGLAARIVLDDCKAEARSMTKMYDWQKIKVDGEKKFNLPEFDSPVLLADKREDGKTFATVATLKSLDANGPHWSTGNDIFSQIFGDIFQERRDMKYPNNFNPTHWCTIRIPQ